MSDDTKIEVETTVAPASETQTPVDYVALIAAKDAELAKTREEKENYRKGMLKAKGKTDSDITGTDQQPDLDTLVAQKVQEAFLNTQESKIQKERDELYAHMAKENSEMRVALANKSQLGAGGSNANQDGGIQVKDQFFSDAQVAALKAKGWDDKKIEALRKNLGKVTPQA